MRVERTWNLGLALLALSSGLALAQPSSAVTRMTFALPGLSVEVLRSVGCSSGSLAYGDATSWGTVIFDSYNQNAPDRALDPLGNLYMVGGANPRDFRCLNNPSSGTWATAIGRLRPDNTYETVLTIAPACEHDNAVGTQPQTLGYDQNAGRLWLYLQTTGDGCLDELVLISGLPTLHEVAATYVPAPPAVTWRVPPMPEGFPSQADSFSVLAGNLGTLPDFSRAERIACNVPEGRAPVAGEELTVPDPLPDPATRTGRYYVVSAERGGEERAGRQRIAGVLSGRTVGITPACP